MKRTLKIICAFVVSLLFSLAVIEGISLSQMQKCFDEELYKNVIRLHVLANSDSDHDQQAKIDIKDSVLEYISTYTQKAQSAKEAASIIKNNLSHIASFVEKTAKDLGYDYSVNLAFSKEKYPVRYYDGFSFPAGEYMSLRIILGKGEGKNWWCVLYPSICNKACEKVPEMLESVGISEKTASYICEDKKYKIRFRLLEYLGF